MPVFTRRASRCIIRWLPNEILTEVIHHLDLYRDLLALCLTSRLVCALATPLLYRTVNLATVPAVSSYFSALRTSSRVRAAFVRELCIGQDPEDLLVPSELVDEIPPTFQDFCHLQCLELSMHVPMISTLWDSHFPALRYFRAYADPFNSTSFRNFLRRHQTLTELEVFRLPTVLFSAGPIPNLGPIYLPNLKIFTGPACFASALVVDIKCFESATIAFLPDDPGLVAALAPLDPSTAGVTPFARLALCIISDDSPKATLECISRIVPHIAIVKLHGLRIRTFGLLSPDTVRNIAQTLTRMTGLQLLMYPGLVLEGGEDETEERLARDAAIVGSWGEACRTLWSVDFHGRTWRRTHKVWQL
ncbi:hypothetical protein DFH07DRAFT_801262 [Mycena maculata]|uniref:F-box domain-containing protein n=1 Tax=Mycena maculata TaxID=230809 RepID=A0AAD7JWX5_9AGAR|nr:hypothetical protein DFH07DRAFT_801262 [Mycena maculata]